ncbi:MAG: Gfo/Idh/MocA family oxidoreductase [Syntrophobacterales bacterium]|nr:Gfo/Idh/MocA family oxidoreductase [Syntrophobacterales bacterium]
MPYSEKGPLRGALVGFGKVAERAHLPALQGLPEFRLVAVADPLPERRNLARELLPEVRLYDHQGALLAGERPLDFLLIATPPETHAELARQGLEAGCQVLCEKPLTLDLQVLAGLHRLAQARGRALVTVHNWKFAPLYRAAQTALAQGLIGEVREIVWEVHRTPGSGGGLTDWRHTGAAAGGGILVDHGWHAFYLLLGLAGGAPEALRARLAPAPENPAGVEQEAEVELRFPRARARLFLTWRAERRRNAGRLVGTSGELLLEDDRLLKRRDGRLEELAAFPEPLSGGSHHPEWTRGSWEEFALEIRNPDLRGRNLAEAAHCARLITLAYRSHQGGGAWLTYPPA